MMKKFCIVAFLSALTGCVSQPSANDLTPEEANALYGCGPIYNEAGEQIDFLCR